VKERKTNASLSSFRPPFPLFFLASLVPFFYDPTSTQDGNSVAHAGGSADASALETERERERKTTERKQKIIKKCQSFSHNKKPKKKRAVEIFVTKKKQTRLRARRALGPRLKMASAHRPTKLSPEVNR
jgi:hypothetical protein